MCRQALRMRTKLPASSSLTRQPPVYRTNRGPRPRQSAVPVVLQRRRIRSPTPQPPSFRTSPSLEQACIRHRQASHRRRAVLKCCRLRAYEYAQRSALSAAAIKASVVVSHRCIFPPIRRQLSTPLNVAACKPCRPPPRTPKLPWSVCNPDAALCPCQGVSRAAGQGYPDMLTAVGANRRLSPSSGPAFQLDQPWNFFICRTAGLRWHGMAYAAADQSAILQRPSTLVLSSRSSAFGDRTRLGETC